VFTYTASTTPISSRLPRERNVHDAANCAVRVHIENRSDSNPGPLPFTGRRMWKSAIGFPEMWGAGDAKPAASSARRAREHHRGDGGDHDSLFLSVAVVSRTLSGLHSTRQGQDFSAALGDADAGVSDALFRIDQLGNAPATTFCVGANAACTVCIGSGRSDRRVHRAARRRQHVHDLREGKVNGQLHAVQATATRSYLYPFAIFAKTSIAFNGNSGNYDSGAGPDRSRPSIPAARRYSNRRPTSRVTARSPATVPSRLRTTRATFKAAYEPCAERYLLPAPTNPQDPLSPAPRRSTLTHAGACPRSTIRARQ